MCFRVVVLCGLKKRPLIPTPVAVSAFDGGPPHKVGTITQIVMPVWLPDYHDLISRLTITPENILNIFFKFAILKTDP